MSKIYFSYVPFCNDTDFSIYTEDNPPSYMDKTAEKEIRKILKTME